MQVPDTFPELFAGVLFIWLCLVVYVIYLGRTVSKLEKQINE